MSALPFHFLNHLVQVIRDALGPFVHVFQPVFGVDQENTLLQISLSFTAKFRVALESPIAAFFDPRLQDFDVIWAAAGTPHHVFRVAPADLLRISSAQPFVFTI